MEKQKRMTAHKRRQSRFNNHFFQCRGLIIGAVWILNRDIVFIMMNICEYYDKKNRNTAMTKNLMTAMLEEKTIARFIEEYDYYKHFGLEDEE